MQSLFSRIIRTGIDPGYPFHLRRKVILLNSMCLVGIFAYIVIFFLNLAKGSNHVFIIPNLSAQFVFIVTILLNRAKMHKAAALFCCSILLLYFNTMAILYGKEGGLEYLNLLLCTSSLIFFDDLLTIILISVSSAAGFFFCRYFYLHHSPLLIHNNLHTIFYANMSALFICLFLIILFFKSEIMGYSQQAEDQRKLLAEKNTLINDSIRYAWRIQKSLLKFDDKIEKALPNAFILYQPKDIVSGDFYWFAMKNGRIFGACGDCTGHGVPGAFMCMIGMTLLNEIINEHPDAAAGEILHHLSNGVVRALKQTGGIGENKDGMDISLCIYHEKSREMEFAAANHSAFVVRGNEIREYKGDRRPIGFYDNVEGDFTTLKLDLKKGDMLYLSTDGYYDQFSGKKETLGRKFKKKNFKELLIATALLDIDTQKEKLKNTFAEWRGPIEQIDDVLVIGVRMG